MIHHPPFPIVALLTTLLVLVGVVTPAPALPVRETRSAPAHSIAERALQERASWVREVNSECALHHRTLHRWYDPAAGRFISRDPIGFAGGPNIYAYVENNPVNFGDPLGLHPGFMTADQYSRQFPHLVNPWGLTSTTNFVFLVDFVLGRGQNVRGYDIGTPEGRDMSASPGARRLRDWFYKNGAQTKYGFEYTTSLGAWDTLLSPAQWPSTALQVGGFVGYAETDPSGHVLFNIDNIAGAHSFFLHLTSDRKSGSGPFRSIYQNFMWIELIDVKKCPGEK